MKVIFYLFCCAIAFGQSQKESKLKEIDQKIVALQVEIDTLKALRTAVSSGQIPEAALSMIVISPVSEPAKVTATPVPLFSTAATPPVSVLPSPPSPATSTNDKPTGTTASGATIYTGPRGGQYHYSSSGKKVYEKHK